MSITFLEKINILLVDDSPSDVELVKEAFSSSTLHNLYIAEDGIEAMDFLYKHGRFANSPTPNLILLDLNLPKKDGREVLAEIKNTPILKIIPVVILTTSSAEQDVLKSYELQANCYVTKPVDLEQFNSVIQSIEYFWLSIVQLPLE